MTLAELKAKATELGLTPDEVRQHGSLSCKATWETAIAEFEEMKVAVDTHCEQMGIPQWSYDWEHTDTDIAVTVNQSVTEDLPFDNPTHTLIDGEWVLCSEIACLIDHPALCEGELIEPAPDSNYLGKDDRGLPTHLALTDTDTDKIDIYSLKPDSPITPIITIDNVEEKLLTLTLPSATPLRDELTQRMACYVGDTMTPQEFESLQNEPLDEMTAAVYLGWLEGSEQVLVEALAA